MDYSSAAGTYANHRWALPWKLAPLCAALAVLREPCEVLEVGCGTGDYLRALHERFPAARCRGFDRSGEMLAAARARCPWAALELGDADRAFPVGSAESDLVYVVDVLHHLERYDIFFSEAARTLRSGARLVALSDSAEDIRARSLAICFPATVAINLERYPDLGQLEALAARAGFRLESRRTASGELALDDRFLETLAQRALSELRLIDPEEHKQGLAEARAMQARGDGWRSQTTALTWTRH